MYNIKTEKFEGPLDLLLSLIEGEKLDITEISLAKITDKFLSETSTLDPRAHDVAEFMLVAARLLYLKSKVLLPTLETAEEEAEVQDLKDKLEIYKKYREAAQEFSSILNKNQRSYSAKKPRINIPTFTPPKGVDLGDLWRVFNKLLKDMPQELAREEIEIPTEKVTVEEKIIHLETIFSKKKIHKFSHIISESKSRVEAIVIFLALLEMVKCKKLKFSQKNSFEEIELKWVN